MNNRHILIIDDQLMFMQIMGKYLTDAKLATSLTIADTCEKGLAIVKKEKPQIVFQDITFLNSPMQGFDCLQSIKKIDKTIKVLMLSNSNEIILIKKALENNADGYLNKGAPIEDLVSAINVVESDNIYLHDDEITEELYRNYDNIKIGDKKMISKRELEILELISQGNKSSKIAKQLFISPYTVETHRRKLLDKLQAENVAHLVKRGFEFGLLKASAI
ncbi:MAG: response regulator transcription factor [Chitinophagales bacterium]